MLWSSRSYCNYYSFIFESYLFLSFEKKKRKGVLRRENIIKIFSISSNKSTLFCQMHEKQTVCIYSFILFTYLRLARQLVIYRVCMIYNMFISLVKMYMCWEAKDSFTHSFIHSIKKAVLKNFAIFTRKHSYWSLFLSCRPSALQLY